MEEKLLQLTVQVTGPSATKKLEGRDHAVFPAVLVRQQVLHNNLGRTFLPADEIEASADSWNNIPAVIRHPSKRGMPVSARDPEVLNSRGVGRIFNARFEDDALKGDVWIDMARAADIADALSVVNGVQNGEVGEVSTGFATQIEHAPGKWGDSEYDYVLHDLRPDHLALLPDEIGACSVTDGCGLGVNHAGDCDTEQPGPELPEPPSSVAHEPVARNRWYRQLFAVLVDKLGLGPSTNESDEDRKSLLRAALRETFGGDNVYLWIEAVFSEDGYVVYERDADEDAGLFRVDFDMSDDGVVSFTSDPVEVRRVTTFEPVANTTGTTTPEEGSNMNRDQMIAHLVGAGRDKTAMEALNDCDLKALCAATKATNSEPTLPEPRPDDSEAMRIAHQYRRENEQLRAQFGPAAENLERERATLTDDIVYNTASEWTFEDLKAKSIEEVRKIHRTMYPSRNFSSRGGPRAAGVSATPAGSMDFVRGILSAPAGESALDEKEIN